MSPPAHRPAASSRAAAKARRLAMNSSTVRHLCRPAPDSPLPAKTVFGKARNNHVEANITPDILWMSRGYYHILLFYTRSGASRALSAAKLRWAIPARLSDNRPPQGQVQRPFMVQVCGRLWKRRKKGIVLGTGRRIQQRPARNVRLGESNVGPPLLSLERIFVDPVKAPAGEQELGLVLAVQRSRDLMAIELAFQ